MCVFFNNSLILCICLADSTKLMPMKSTLLSIANLIIDLSRFVTNFPPKLTWGTLIPLELFKVPFVSAIQIMSFPTILLTINFKVPSSAKIISPTLKYL